METRSSSHDPGYAVGIGIAVGAGLGMLFALMTGWNIALGVGIGAALGIVFGSAYDTNRRGNAGSHQSPSQGVHREV